MEFQGDKTKVGLYLSGQQIEIPGANIFIEQPTIKQIVNFGEDNFLIAVNLLSRTENFIQQIKEGNSELVAYSNFQLLMIVLKEDESVRKLVQNLFGLIFPNYLIDIQEFGINFLIEDEQGKRNMVGQIHPYNFDEFQKLIGDLFTDHRPLKEDERPFNPANDAAAIIAKKLERGRARKAEAQGQKSIFGVYCSVLSIGLCMDINVFFNYTVFQLYDAYNRFMDKMQADLYMRVSTMPFLDVSNMDKPDEWGRNLY